MKYKYTITPRDIVYLNYNIVGEKHLKRLRGNLRFTPLLLIFVLVIFQMREGSNISIPFIVVAGILYILFISKSNDLLDQISIRRINKMFKNEDNKWLMNERTMEIKDDRIIETIDHLKGLEEKELLNLAYEDVFTIDKSTEGVYIFVNDQSAFIIPKRAFKSDDEMEETFKYLEEKVESAKAKKEEIIVAEDYPNEIIIEKNTNQEEEFW